MTTCSYCGSSAGTDWAGRCKSCGGVSMESREIPTEHNTPNRGLDYDPFGLIVFACLFFGLACAVFGPMTLLAFVLSILNALLRIYK